MFDARPSVQALSLLASCYSSSIRANEILQMHVRLAHKASLLLSNLTHLTMLCTTVRMHGL